MEPWQILTIVGAFGTLGISVNAAFLKGIQSQLSALQIGMAEILRDSKHYEDELERMRIKVHDHSTEISALKMRLHSIEGAQKNLISYIESRDAK